MSSGGLVALTRQQLVNILYKKCLLMSKTMTEDILDIFEKEGLVVVRLDEIRKNAKNIDEVRATFKETLKNADKNGLQSGEQIRQLWEKREWVRVYTQGEP